MADSLDVRLARWEAAGLLDAATAARIRAWEAEHGGGGRLGGLVVGALTAGGLMLAAGLLLFVAANWDELSPTIRMTLLVLLVGGLHVAGALVAARFRALAATLHAVGTVAFAGAVFLAGQTFHLDAHWPTGILLWALGATAGALLVGTWPQAALTALLWPGWVLGEWKTWDLDRWDIVVAGLLQLSLVYLLAARRGETGAGRRTLERLGALGVPVLMVLLVATADFGEARQAPAFAWLVAFGAPLALAVVLRGAGAWQALVGFVWVLFGLTFDPGISILAYLWSAAGALAIVAAGVQDGRRTRIDIGMSILGLTIMAFYGSGVMTKLGRASTLLVGGVLLVALGIGLDRLRRTLVRRAEASA